MFSVITIPDVAWAVDAFVDDPTLPEGCADVVRAMVGPAREAIEQAQGVRALWHNRYNANVMTFEAMSDRREWLRSFLSDALGREPVLGDAEDMARRWDEQPSIAVPTTLPTQNDEDAADAAETLMNLNDTTPVPQFTEAERAMLDRALGGAIPSGRYDVN